MSLAVPQSLCPVPTLSRDRPRFLQREGTLAEVSHQQPPIEIAFGHADVRDTRHFREVIQSMRSHVVVEPDFHGTLKIRSQ